VVIRAIVIAFCDLLEPAAVKFITFVGDNGDYRSLSQIEIDGGIEISRQVTAVVLFWSTSLDTEQTLAASELISFVV
jgi:hypothetical protein